jgi:hypothetical protein
VSDPFNAYTVPTAGDCANTVALTTGVIGTQDTITCDSASTITNATFSGTVVLTAPSVTFGGNISSDTTSTDYGTTLVFATGGFTENAGTVFNLSPQASTATTKDLLPSVVLAAPTTNTSLMQLQFGNSSGTFNGIVYMPKADFLFQDSGGDHSGGLTFNINLVVGELDDKTSTLNINGYTPPVGSPDPLNIVTLVE